MLAMIEKGDWLYSFDLKAGYHQVDICESYQTFGFSCRHAIAHLQVLRLFWCPHNLYVCPHLEDDHAIYTCCIGRMHSLATTFSPARKMGAVSIIKIADLEQTLLNLFHSKTR